MATEQTQTIAQTLASASKQLAECSDSANLDARVLLAHVLRRDLTYLLTWSDKTVEQTQLVAFEQLVQKRLSGEPIAYIVGVKEFWSLPFFVAPSTLIPRPDTETLVELVLNHHSDNNTRLLDLGTGTGAIALALASEHKNWRIDAVDFNVDAVELAQKNAKNLAVEHVNIYQSDWFSTIDKHEKFDVIVSNPPYIDQKDHHLDEGDVRFEPKSALVADKQGLADIEHICQQATQYLVNGGALYIEHGYQQGEAVRKIMENNYFKQCTTTKDLAGNDRITWAILSK